MIEMTHAKVFCEWNITNFPINQKAESFSLKTHNLNGIMYDKIQVQILSFFQTDSCNYTITIKFGNLI